MTRLSLVIFTQIQTLPICGLSVSITGIKRNLVVEMAKALEAFHKANLTSYNEFLAQQKNNPDFSSLSDFYYMQSWVGLENSIIFQIQTDNDFLGKMALYNDIAKSVGTNCPK